MRAQNSFPNLPSSPNFAQRPVDKQIDSAVGKAEDSYLKCWDMLIKHGTYTISYEIVNFQEELGDTVLELGYLYHEIRRERKGLNRKKAKLNKRWYSKRAETLDMYSTVILDVIKIGKEMGDDFAWFFYRNDRKLLNNHLKHDEVGSSPPGIGGIGELEFISQFKLFEGKLVIYHGITTCLRIADASPRTSA